MTEEEERPERHIADDEALDNSLNLPADVPCPSPRTGEDRHERARRQMEACLAEVRTAVAQARRSLAPPLVPR